MIASNASGIPKTRGDAITKDFSARHAKNMHRDMKKDRRFNPIAGEEVGYSSESGNEREDYENSHYDNRMVPADKKARAELEWKIKSIKTNVVPKEFTIQRQNALRSSKSLGSSQLTFLASNHHGTSELDYPM